VVKELVVSPAPCVDASRFLEFKARAVTPEFDSDELPDLFVELDPPELFAYSDPCASADGSTLEAE